MKIKYPKIILSLISFLQKLPGVGKKTATRFCFDLLKWNEIDLKIFSKLLYELKKNIKYCDICGCIKENTCLFCENNERDKNKICIISSSKDAFSIEKISQFTGLYHVISLISPLTGKMIDENNVEKLRKRIENNSIKEMIIAFDSTLEGDATALFLKNRFKNIPIKISRIAFGLPVGSSLEYIDESTLAQSFLGRQDF